LVLAEAGRSQIQNRPLAKPEFNGVGGLQTHIMSCAGPPPAHSPGNGPSTPPALGPFSLPAQAPGSLKNHEGKGVQIFGEAGAARWQVKDQ
jgi:hypothetical protein